MAGRDIGERLQQHVPAKKLHDLGGSERYVASTSVYSLPPS